MRWWFPTRTFAYEIKGGVGCVMHRNQALNHKIQESRPMVESTKTENDKSGAKLENLRLNNETLKDLGASNPHEVKGGARPRCTYHQSGCTSAGE